MASKLHDYDQTIYLLQGGGALGAYQVGVCQGLLEYGCEPDWLIGTSIGAINASIIAGNEPANRIPKLKEFWHRISSPFPCSDETHNLLQQWQNFISSQWTVFLGQPGFFRPRILNPLSYFVALHQMSFYETSELRETLTDLIDFDLINQKQIRLSLGVIEIENGSPHYFDNMQQRIGPEHIIASAALPPGFPAVEIDGKYYWDGGISAIAPIQAVVKENLPQSLLCFMAELFVPHRQTEPDSYSANLNIIRFCHRDRPSDLWTKDFEFSIQSINERLEMGYQDVQNTLRNPKWHVKN